MRTAIYPGSFDPITNGHLDIIKRSAKIFDKVIITVSVNSSKRPLFTIDERIELVNKVISDIPNAEVTTFTGLLAEFAENVNAQVIIKGLRAISDFEYEFQMALMNKKITENVETMFMMTSQEYSYLSSSLVKEVGSLGGDLNGLIPDEIMDEIKFKLKNYRRNL